MCSFKPAVTACVYRRQSCMSAHKRSEVADRRCKRSTYAMNSAVLCCHQADLCHFEKVEDRETKSIALCSIRRVFVVCIAHSASDRANLQRCKAQEWLAHSA